MRCNVFISGGGIAGLTLAVKLVRAGISTALVEKELNPSVKYKGELLQPKSLEILEGLGLLENALQSGYPIHTTSITEQLARSTKHISFRYDVLPPPFNYALMIPHEMLKELLLAEAQKSPYFHYMRPAKFLAFQEDSRSKRTALIERRKGDIEEWAADFFVGAEGRISPVRTGAAITLQETTYNHHFLTVSFPRPSSLQQAEMIVRRHSFLGLFPLPDDRVRSVFLIKPEEYKSIRKGGLPFFYEQYCRLYPALDGFVQQIHSWKQIQLMIPIRHNARQYVKENCIIIGDAAHSVHPMAGEGMNLAVQDADTLGDLLTWMYTTGQLAPRHLRWFEAIRKPQAEYISRLSHQSALAYSYSFPLWCTFRSHVLKRMETEETLHFKQMLNISGLGVWKESWLDRFVQAGLLPSSVLPDKSAWIRQNKPYPWLTDK